MLVCAPHGARGPHPCGVLLTTQCHTVIITYVLQSSGLLYTMCKTSTWWCCQLCVVMAESTSPDCCVEIICISVSGDCQKHYLLNNKGVKQAIGMPLLYSPGSSSKQGHNKKPGASSCIVKCALLISDSQSPQGPIRV
jgi:hypothetical protein